MKPVIENFHDEYRVFVEYTTCLLIGQIIFRSNRYSTIEFSIWVSRF